MQEFFLDYCLIQKLSHKKSRHTYLGYARQTAQPQLVIKLFDAECVTADQKQGQLFAELLLSLKHPHIVPVVDIAIKQGKPYVVSEYRAHGSLDQRLKSVSPARMEWPEAVSIVIQIGQALCEAHARGIVHGNLKPENIFYAADCEVQLADFSLASFLDVAKLGYKSDLSTIRYMAPEQFMGKTDQQSDQYSLACLAYELIAGKPPFDAGSFSSMWGQHKTEHVVPLVNMVPEVPMAIDLAIRKALAKKPHERYKDVATFIVALERGLSIQVTDLPSSLQNSSVVNVADTLLLAKLRSQVPISELPISSASTTRPLSELEEMRADHAVLPVLDSAEQPTATTQDQRTAGSAPQTAAQAMEAAPALPAYLSQSQKPTKAYVLWVSVVSLLVILAGTLGFSVFGASFLPLPFHIARINGKQNVNSGIAKTAIVSATDMVHVTPTVHSRTQSQATASPEATAQASAGSMVTPTGKAVSPLPIAIPTELGREWSRGWTWHYR